MDVYVLETLRFEYGPRDDGTEATDISVVRW